MGALVLLGGTASAYTEGLKTAIGTRTIRSAGMAWPD